jgi:membrane protein YqaA with SNARE-associated domain
MKGVQHIFGGSAWGWIMSLGGPGLILLGLADNSVIPLPGSMDVLTIVLAANHREFWWYYSLMATVGAVIGGYLTYRLGREGGKEMLERKVPKRRVDKVYRTFKRWGFWAVAVPALLPPPVPIVPFLLAAGALKYPRKRFVAALALGRAIRFTLIGFIASHFGTRIFHFFSRYYKPALYSLIALAVLGGAVGLWFYIRYRRRKEAEAKSGPDRQVAARPRSRKRVA